VTLRTATQWLNLVCFVALAAVAAHQWRRRRSAETQAIAVLAASEAQLTKAQQTTQQAEAALIVQASHDELTQLPNRNSFMEQLEHALSSRGEARLGMAVLFMDIDRFKWLNDSLGHSVGDEVLKAIGTRAMGTMRPGDLLARFGGDEFVALCTDVTEHEAVDLAQRVAAEVGRTINLGDGGTELSLSIGIAHSPDPKAGDTAETLVRDADAAMYRAKEEGRDRIRVFDHKTRAAAVTRHETANALRKGIPLGDLEIHYQPEIDIASGAMAGVEALVRWNHPERGLLQPNEFIAVAEETGLVVPMGTDVLRRACGQMADWRRAGGRWADVSLSVNIAARQLLAPNLASVVNEILVDQGLAPDALVLEITESVLLKDSGASARALGRLKDLGVRIAVDDFGTGFSSLTYLKRFPVDILKIDRSFVEGLGTDEQDRAIVASVIDLAHGFGLTTVAEGVETVEQLSELRSLGCELGQGYLWSRAMPAPAATTWLDRRSPTATNQAATSGASKRWSVLLVEDDRSLRGLLRLIFDAEDDFDVVGETGDGREAVALARHHRPDLVLLDLAMPGMGGLEALPLIRSAAPGSIVAVLSGLDNADLAELSRRKGASAYVMKGLDPTLLCDQLRPLFTQAQ